MNKKMSWVQKQNACSKDKMRVQRQNAFYQNLYNQSGVREYIGFRIGQNGSRPQAESKNV